MVRVVHISESDQAGGAGRAAYRLHNTLRRKNTNIESTMLVGNRATNDPSVCIARRGVWGKIKSIIYPYINYLPIRYYKRRINKTFSSVWSCYGEIKKSLDYDKVDIICLHWVAGGFLSPGSLKRLNKPIVWRLSDLWPFTGGCHFPGDCRSYEQACGQCPVLSSNAKLDLSRFIFNKKKKSWQDLDIIVVAPSNWIATCARRSAMFRNLRIEVIPTGVDLSIFRPIDMATARDLLGLPKNKKLLLFGALAATDDPRKGYVPMVKALENLAERDQNNCHLVIFGGPSEQPQDVALPLPTTFLGKLNDDLSLTLLYSAADVLVAPYLEDNLPNVALEALACGTPVVGFDTSGMPDIIDHKVNGYLVQAFDPKDLVEGILWCLDGQKKNNLRTAARKKAEENFSLERCALKYERLFQELVASR